MPVTERRSLMKRLAFAAGAVLVIGGLRLFAQPAQKTIQVMRPPVIESTYGPDLYRHYCATCHGKDATGNGPVAGALKVPPPDLTVLARRQKGVFPAAEVEAVIRGGPAVPAHGSGEMPVWGPIFRALDPSDARVKMRIASLVAHIESVQLR
jgi:mono/diheme cytochrome c family protein